MTERTEGSLDVPTSEKFVRVVAGDRVVLGIRGDEVDAEVLLVSDTGRSLLVTFDGMIGAWAGGMPLTWSDRHEHFYNVLQSGWLRVTLTKKEASDAGAIV